MSRVLSTARNIRIMASRFKLFGSSASKPPSENPYYDSKLTPRVQPNAHDPTLAWQRLSVKQVVEKVHPQPHDVPKPDGHIRMVCISDTHNRTDHMEVPPGDILVHAGDFTNVGLEGDVRRFKEFLAKLPHKHKVIIAGNHDLTFDLDNYDTLCKTFAQHGHRNPLDAKKCRNILLDAGVCTYLEDSEVTIGGYRIYGSPWQPEFCDWGFNLRRGEKCLEKWDLIPEGVDILITHGPPIGHGDLCSSQLRAGCVDLLHTIQTRVKPKYHVFGHIHEGYGITTDGVTTYINASTCNLRYQPINPPIIIDLPVKQ
ncbi:metallophosphoesterase MPPED2-like [Dysidea avara]|uniref:metallophosphoesterase MPPED2-like n=1 Tax=Dysidea avara TaxID=196820 RepID=UPI0033278DFD